MLALLRAALVGLMPDTVHESCHRDSIVKSLTGLFTSVVLELLSESTPYMLACSSPPLVSARKIISQSAAGRAVGLAHLSWTRAAYARGNQTVRTH
jgi:hypothetical protein